MVHKEVYKQFELYFPLYAGKNVEVWFPNGKNSVRVRQKNGQEFIFSYSGKDDWKFETRKSFINYLNERR